LCGVSSSSHAGQNSSAFAELSWEPDEILVDRTSLPSGTFPLYIRLHGVVSARVIGVDVRWFPKTADSLCYAMVDGPESDSCGRILDLPPISILPDTGYTRSITLASPPSGDVCVAAWFSHEHCPGIQPGRFFVAALVLEDSTGGRDLVPVLTEATILGGEGIEQPLALQSSTATWLTPGRSNEFHLQGVGLDAVTEATLDGPSGPLTGEVWNEGARSLLVTFDVPEEYSGEARLFVVDGGQLQTSLPTVVMVADTTAETGDGLNGTGYPFFKPTPGGMWRKSPDRSEWEFVPEVPDSIVNKGGASVESYLRQHTRQSTRSIGRELTSPRPASSHRSLRREPPAPMTTASSHWRSRAATTQRPVRSTSRSTWWMSTREPCSARTRCARESRR